MQGFLKLLPIIFFCALLSQSRAQNQTVENGFNTTTINFPGTGCLYNWTNDNPSIGLPAGGTGDISSFKAINSGNEPITATITATPVGYAYIISNQNPGTPLNTVSVINTATHALVTSIKVGSDPIGIAASPDGSRVYVTNTLGASVSVINTSLNTVIANIPVGSYPWGIVVSPDGNRVYNTNFNDKNISVIDAKTNTVLRKIPAGPDPYCIAISPDGKRVYVTGYYSNTLTVIDIASGAIIATITTGIKPRFVVASPDGSKVYLSNSGSNSISVISTATDTITNTIPVEAYPEPIVLNLDGTRLYVQNTQSGNVSVINTSTSTIIATLPTGGGSNGNGIAISPDGTRVYVTNAITNKVTVINAMDNTVYATLDIGEHPRGIGNFIIGGRGCGITTFTVTVNPTLTPTLTSTENSIALNTIYGTSSPASNFTLTGIHLKNSVLITAPLGFEVSADNINFSQTISVGAAGTLNTTIYTRIANGVSANIYSGNITISSPGASLLTISTTGTVNPAPLYIQMSPVSKTYGSILTNSLSSDFKVVGLKNADIVDHVYASYGAEGANAECMPGAYINSVTGSLAAGKIFSANNYAITYLPATINVVAAPLIITADNKTKYLNEPNPTLTVSYAGFVNKESIDQLAVQPSVSTNAMQSSPAGNYTIDVYGAASPQYTISYKLGTLTILELESIRIPNTFTPNGDGVNDEWKIRGLIPGQKCKLNIYQRSGQLVFTSNYYHPWDGTFNGKALPVGTYYFVMGIDEEKVFTGSLSIIR